MRWTQARHVLLAILLLFTFLSLLSWRRNEFSNYLPEAHRYFHPNESQVPPADGSPEGSPVVPEFLQRPLWSYDEAVKLSSDTCPTEGVNFGAGSVQENEQRWRDISSIKISDWRHDIAAHLERKSAEERQNAVSNPGSRKGGRGIVMAAGDRHAFVRARTNIRFLSSYNCTLPVEIFHFPGEYSDFSQLDLQDGRGHTDMKVTVRKIEGISKGNGWKAFEIKGAAIEQSSFDEILYLDTDSYLLRNPGYLFEGDHFQETGLLLWPDYTKSHPTNPLWRLVGMPCRNEYEGESGQIVISRSKHQDMMWAVEYFAIHHDEFYGFMGGDRDSFRAAALLLGKKWSGPGRLNAAAGVALKDNPRGGGHTMLQADPEGRWMFVHANLIKHSHFPRPLWRKIHRAANDEFDGTSTYGSIDPPNDKLGDGVRLRVDQAPQMVTTMEPMEGYDESLVALEDWDSYEELNGFEKKWFGAGGVH